MGEVGILCAADTGAVAPLQVRPALLRKTLMQTQVVTRTQPRASLPGLVGRFEESRVSYNTQSSGMPTSSGLHQVHGQNLIDVTGLPRH